MTDALIARLTAIMNADGNRYECVLSIAEVREIIAELKRIQAENTK